MKVLIMARGDNKTRAGFVCFFPGNAQFALTDSSPQKNIACARLSVSADERKQRASSQKASKRTMAERSREGIEPVNISTNTSLHLLPSPLPEKKKRFSCQNDKY